MSAQILECRYRSRQADLLLQQHALQHDQGLPLEGMQELSQAQAEVLISLILAPVDLFREVLLKALSSLSAHLLILDVPQSPLTHLEYV